MAPGSASPTAAARVSAPPRSARAERRGRRSRARRPRRPAARSPCSPTSLAGLRGALGSFSRAGRVARDGRPAETSGAVKPKPPNDCATATSSVRSPIASSTVCACSTARRSRRRTEDPAPRRRGRAHIAQRRRGASTSRRPRRRGSGGHGLRALPAHRRRLRVRRRDDADLLPRRAGLRARVRPLNIAATNGVPPHEQGLASGLVNPSFQFGGALVLAIATAVNDAGGRLEQLPGRAPRRLPQPRPLVRQARRARARRPRRTRGHAPAPMPARTRRRRDARGSPSARRR